jgi:hypothetical protein
MGETVPLALSMGAPLARARNRLSLRNGTD